MRFRNLDLNLLVALDTLIRVRNVSRAADEMFITQSAMSNALGRLRDYFDDPLLIQVGRSMELSPLASSLEPSLRDIIVRIEAAIVSTPSFIPDEATRTISLMVSDYTLQTIMPTFLQIVTAQAPRLHFDFKPQRNVPHLLLERGEADLLIAPAALCSPNHPFEVLFRDPFCCVVAEDGPFVGARLTEQEFLSSGHVVMQPPNGGESFALRSCEQLGLDIRIEVTTYSFTSLPLQVRHTGRIAIVQRSLAEIMLPLGGMRIMEPPVALPALEQAMQWHSYRTRDPALTWIREQVRAASDMVHKTAHV